MLLGSTLPAYQSSSSIIRHSLLHPSHHLSHHASHPHQYSGTGGGRSLCGPVHMDTNHVWWPCCAHHCSGTSSDRWVDRVQLDVNTRCKMHKFLHVYQTQTKEFMVAMYIMLNFRDWIHFWQYYTCSLLGLRFSGLLRVAAHTFAEQDNCEIVCLPAVYQLSTSSGRMWLDFTPLSVHIVVT